jgi:LacI family gluconate utilization system Gnt-I transcriptional repressor
MTVPKVSPLRKPSARRGASDSQRRVTMSDVAKLAGVAPMTVSNCFRASSRVHPETLAKVTAAAKKLGYVRNLVAGGLASGRNQVIGVLVPSLQNSNFAQTLQGLEDRLHVLEYQLMLAVAATPEREQASVRTFIERRVDGIVLTGVEHDAATIDLLRSSGLAVVETWSLRGPFIDMGVGFSLYDAAREMAALMVQRGYRRIGFAGFNPPMTDRFHERQRGFQDAMKAAGLRSDLLAYAEQSAGFAAGRITMDALLVQDPELDALFCATDILAAGAIFECARRRWPVPGRMGIAGYGNYEIASEMTPKLTTVSTPGYEMGVAAADMLVAKLSGDTPRERIRDVGYALTLRDSL